MKQLSDKPIILFDIDYTLFNTAHLKETNLAEFLLYEEVTGVLEELSPLATLGILSEGTTEWQEKKLHETDIVNFFDKKHTHIVEKKFNLGENILKGYKSSDRIFIIDDKLTFLFEMKSVMPALQTVWIKRGVYAMNQSPISGFTPDFTIDTLNELVPLIKNLE